VNPLIDQLPAYPFQRLTSLLSGPPGGAPVVMSLGESQHAPPAFVAKIIAQNAAGWGRYPPMHGTPDFRAAVKEWLCHRFSLPPDAVDANRHIVPVAGTREALHQIAHTVIDPVRQGRKPVVLMPNPFYQIYEGAALIAGAEPHYVPAPAETGHLPDLESLPADVLARTALAYVCSPANPQGAVATPERLQSYIRLARARGFVLVVDECYSEIHDRQPPAGALQAALGLGDHFDNLLVFHSLSKRSGCPGLRSGFVAGDPAVLAAFSRLRAYGSVAVPQPILAASAALWRDEKHVEAGNKLYRAKIDLAASILGNRLGFYRPQGGFFLWLEAGDGEIATKRLWSEAGIRVMPGAYLAHAGADGRNPGRAHIRVALVHDLKTTERALRRLGDILAEG